MSNGRVKLAQAGSAVAVILGAVGLLLTASGVAGASGSSSPTPPSSTTCSTSSTLTVKQNAAPVSASLGETCAFAPNSQVTLAYAGSQLTPVTTDSSGLISLAISAKDPEISINGGAYQSAVYGLNTITASGTNPAGGANTATFVIDLVTVSVATSASSTSGGLAFTGADLAAMVIGGLILVALGTAAVAYARRRGQRANAGGPS
jgi:hypothetical protein